MTLRYYRAMFRHGITGILREVLRAMRDGDNVELRIVDAMIERIRTNTAKMMEQTAVAQFGKVRAEAGFSAEPNLAPLREMLLERQAYFDQKLARYRFLVQGFETPAVKIGRRGHDVIRELSLDTLEEGFLRGNPTALTTSKLAQRIVKSGTLYSSEEAAREALISARRSVLDNIPLFHEDGSTKFMLHTRAGGVYAGKYRAYDVEGYADLVAFTTAGEADASANVALAREIGTRIIKWNSTGKGVAFYRSIGDDRCANVDGQYASIEPSGTEINGVFYPYYKSPSRLPGLFDTCHPNCRHRMSPVPEETLRSA